MHTTAFRRTLPVLVYFIIATTRVNAQPDISRVLVSDSLLRKHVYTLASDSLQGRQTGTAGQLKAALYCTQSFRQSRLVSAFRIDSVKGSFYQPYFFTFTNVTPFGGQQGKLPFTYKRYELTPAPRNGKPGNTVQGGHNVAGLLVGTDLGQEVVVVSAHYDHLGRSEGQIFHGADDNASGTATVLSIASVFDSLARKGIRSRRSILFLLFSGEENGLLGSEYFVYNSPIPMQQIVCDLNIDMVGRVDHKHRKKSTYCYLIAGKQDDVLRKAATTANQRSVQIELDHEYDTENDPNQYFYRSDHYNFARFGIPVLFFMDGEHPDYHQPSDTADKIAYDVLQKRATLVFQTAWLIANPNGKN